MLTLLSPAGLWALAALSLPLALHLWRRPPRTVRLGSLRFLERMTRLRPRDWRWHERLLLALRLLLLAALALMLSRPHWRPASLDLPQHWVLLDPTAAPQGASQARLQALQAAGYEVHGLAAGFPKWTGTTPQSPEAPDLWSLLREADAGLPAGSSLAVFTPGRLASLRGERPALARCHCEWVLTPDRAGAPPAAKPRSGPAPVSVLIVHDASRAEDARYIAAAVRAVAQAGGRRIVLTAADALPEDTAIIPADWVFWLAGRPPPETLAASAGNLLTDAEIPAGASVDTTPGWIVAPPGVPGAEALADPVRLWRRVTAPTAASEVVFWTDGFGRPLLTQSRQGEQRRWRFCSRFQPDWTDLPRTTALPDCLRSLLLPETNAPLFADPVRDLRRADAAQLPPITAAPGSRAVSLPLHRDTPGWQSWCWLLAATLFGLERFLSHRRSDALQPGGGAPIRQPEIMEAR